MPLTMPRKSEAWDDFRDAVAFPAEDPSMGVPVSCAISDQALATHFGGIFGNLTSLVMAFRRYRPVIERAASAKYDNLGKPNIVLLTPEDFGAVDAPPNSAPGAEDERKA